MKEAAKNLANENELDDAIHIADKNKEKTKNKVILRQKSY